MTTFHRRGKSITQLEREGKYTDCDIRVWRRLWDTHTQKKVKRTSHHAVQVSWEFIWPLPCWSLSVAVSGSAEEKQLPAKELHFAWKRNRNLLWAQKQPSSPWCCHDAPSCATSVSLWGSCSTWHFSDVQTKVTRLLSLAFLNLKRTRDQSLEEKQIKRSQHLQGTRHVCLVFVQHLGQTQNFSKAWFVTLNHLDHQDCFRQEPRKPKLSTTVPRTPKDGQSSYMFCLLKRLTRGGTKACLGVTEVAKGTFLHPSTLN